MDVKSCAFNPIINTVYVLPVATISVLFYLPKFFEAYVDRNDEVIIRRLRRNEDYIFWYVNVANLLLTGVIPLASLCFLNARIYSGDHRKARTPNSVFLFN